MKNNDIKQILEIILESIKDYDEKLNNRHFLIIYQYRKSIKTCCVGFRDMNYLHLTGIKTKLSAQQFYNAGLNGKLSIKDIRIDAKGKCQQKLTVIPYLSELLYHNCMIGDFINSGITISADYFIGNTKAIISVGFRKGKSTDIPVTLYREDIKKLSRPTCKVLAIFSKMYNEKFYNKCTFRSKEFDIEEVFEEIKEKLDKDIYT